MQRKRTRSAALFVLTLFTAAACSTPESRQSSPYAPAPDPSAGPPREVLEAQKPWTESFRKKSLLIATEVRIEGPDGLLAHVATSPDPEFHERIERTTPAGFLQQITLLEGVGLVEIKGQLDNLQLVATRRLIVLERPGPVDVTVTAHGDAFWIDQETKAEKRGETLSFVGKIAR